MPRTIPRLLDLRTPVVAIVRSGNIVTRVHGTLCGRTRGNPTFYDIRCGSRVYANVPDQDVTVRAAVS